LKGKINMSMLRIIIVIPFFMLLMILASGQENIKEL